MSTAATAGDFVATGLLMGVVYVLSGPDHLAAMATIVGGARSKRPGGNTSAFRLGLQWGAGHSLSVLVVGSALIVAAGAASSDYAAMGERLGLALEVTVGLGTAALGLIGVWRSFSHRDGGRDPQSGGEVDDDDDETVSFQNTSASKIAVKVDVPMGSKPGQDTQLLSSMKEVLDQDSNHDGMPSHWPRSPDPVDDLEQRILRAADSLRHNTESGLSRSGLAKRSVTSSSSHEDNGSTVVKRGSSHSLTDSGSAHPGPSGGFAENQTRKRGRPRRATSILSRHSGANSIHSGAAPPPGSSRHYVLNRCCRCLPSEGALAAVAGLVHGASGAGSVLGVVPAPELADPALAAAYLGAFCVTSAVVMGGFAAFYAGFARWLSGSQDSRRYGSRLFLVEVGSSFLSLIVGVVWLILLGAGRIDDIQ